ncbi:MAG: transglycosylase domain-containing protein [Dehalococcoidia bacterium]|jgi:membrane peptidoglycan carboxypeptidase|nr:MAG: Membrane carboxypeptidase (penicillin-binding protein) [Chloroflexota bacterium]|tara:strand:- start:8440 stop:11448 length:3009 start_codon:yes stop_codon:yes gene_type:complete
MNKSLKLLLKKNKGSKNKKKFKKPMLIVGGISAIIFIIGIAFSVIISFWLQSEILLIKNNVIPAEELFAKMPRGGAKIYDRNGILLYQFVDEFEGLRSPVKLEKISPFLTQATIATEDKTFFINNGLNIQGLLRATYENFIPFSNVGFFEGSGGSSITQQLAKNLYIPREERYLRTIERKLKETVIAVELTSKYTKRQILEWYLNSISYGGIYVGIEAASEGYFKKNASELSLAEAAFLAGIPQSPVKYNPYSNFNNAKARQKNVLELMLANKSITTNELETALMEKINLRPYQFEIKAPHFVLGKVAEEVSRRYGNRAIFSDGLKITTTIDYNLQQIGEEVLEEWITQFEEQSLGHNGALIALDAKSSEILVYIGSRDYFRNDIEGRNDNIISKNSPGSTLKPFTYLQAFRKGWTSGTGIVDAPAKVYDPATGEYFEPKNPGDKYLGVATTAKALGNSLNVPALKAILYAGVKDTVKFLKQIGFTTLDSKNGYGPALTLGGVDITLEDITYAYSVLANQGIMVGQSTLYERGTEERILDPISILSISNDSGEIILDNIPKQRRVIESNYTYLITSILSNGENTCEIFGCNSLILPSRPSAQKTGTSEPFEEKEKDGCKNKCIGETWTIGYTPQIIAGNWFGNSNNEPMQNIFSTTVSHKIWKDFMIRSHEFLDLKIERFNRPTGLQEKELCWPSGKIPSKKCPDDRRFIGIFPADNLPRNIDEKKALEDTWWQEIDIDSRTNLLPTFNTPPLAVVKQLRLVLPIQQIEEWDGYRNWAAKNKLTNLAAPIKDSYWGEALAKITSPNFNEISSGTIPIQGRATSLDFQEYELLWATKNNPSTWFRINRSNMKVSNGLLGVWNTTNLPNGDYIIKLLVNDKKLNFVEFITPISINSLQTQVSIDMPRLDFNIANEGIIVKNEMQVTAIKSTELSYQIFLGEGVAPVDWKNLSAEIIERNNLIEIKWNTKQVADGIYRIKIESIHPQLGSISSSAIIHVDNYPWQ